GAVAPRVLPGRCRPAVHPADATPRPPRATLRGPGAAGPRTGGAGRRRRRRNESGSGSRSRRDGAAGACSIPPTQASQTGTVANLSLSGAGALASRRPAVRNRTRAEVCGSRRGAEGAPEPARRPCVTVAALTSVPEETPDMRNSWMAFTLAAALLAGCQPSEEQ